jgi:hypothetical protein
MRMGAWCTRACAVCVCVYRARGPSEERPAVRAPPNCWTAAPSKRCCRAPSLRALACRACAQPVRSPSWRKRRRKRPALTDTLYHDHCSSSRRCFGSKSGCRRMRRRRHETALRTPPVTRWARHGRDRAGGDGPLNHCHVLFRPWKSLVVIGRCVLFFAPGVRLPQHPGCRAARGTVDAAFSQCPHRAKDRAAAVEMINIPCEAPDCRPVASGLGGV